MERFSLRKASPLVRGPSFASGAERSRGNFVNVDEIADKTQLSRKAKDSPLGTGTSVSNTSGLFVSDLRFMTTPFVDIVGRVDGDPRSSAVRAFLGALTVRRLERLQRTEQTIGKIRAPVPLLLLETLPNPRHLAANT